MKTSFLQRKARYFLQTGTVAFILTTFSLMAQAQNRWSIEFRPGVNFATKKLADADLKTGFGAGAIISYRFLPHLGLYTGWSWNRFNASQSFAGVETDFEETGYNYGLQFIHPIGDSRINYLIRAGGLWNHIEVEATDGNLVADSGHGFGWQAELGLAMLLDDHWRVQPGVRYRSLARDLSVGSVSNAVDLKYISVGLGIVRTF
ncbi:outer membrane beta-barrel protein [Salmonirosea aquatica]|uniref:Outer membrane beta-barrel protein n=1 Tax=Salmonirosea aquatica TaxID=2654236 RepID=A0A7C9F4A4_9BACT|nr:outer membrane beta-barrel protein [Cytophagaceae bacterium SJW1-29]